MKTKGQELPMTTIVVTALSLLVLVIVGAFFITGQTQSSGGLAQFVKGSTGDISTTALQANCNTQCTTLAAAVGSVSTCASITWTQVKTYCGKCNGIIACASLLNTNGAVCPQATYCNPADTDTLTKDAICATYINQVACETNTVAGTAGCKWGSDNTCCATLINGACA